MRNSANLAFITLLLIVLGCSCPRAEEPATTEKPAEKPVEKTAGKNTEKAEKSTDIDMNEPSKTENTTFPAAPEPDKRLSMEKFNRLEYGMTYLEAVEVIGFDGRIIKTSPDGMVRYVWGDDYTFIMISFMNDRLSIKTQSNLN